MSAHCASDWNSADFGAHWLVTVVGVAPPPKPPQQPFATLPVVGNAAPTPTVNVDSAWNFVFWFLPILLRFSEASDDFDFFMYSMKAGIATAARMPMIATTIMSSMSVKPRCLSLLSIAAQCSNAH